ncbi:MAG TPA: S8 family serine peptidase, partial [Acidimicrobiales bacterium]|nr:S8 family serine peptidase [Acidimicrobiales bacterium]
MTAVVLVLAVAPGAAATHVPGATRTATTSAAWIPGDPLDCTNWRYGPADEPASLPPEFDRNDYKRTSLRDPNPSLVDSPQNQCGQKGSAVDLAWGLSEGSPSVRIAVLDSGIRWRDPGSMADLATKAYINLGEAQPPCWPAVADGDCNHDGVFNITDFGPIPDLNHNGVADPEDLILDPAYSNGKDDDHDGYVDDISGWDFLYGDNDPLDTVDYGHGTGEAKDSTAAANGTGDVGTCPNCLFIPVRVGDSFIADGGRFAAGVLFGLDSGADVIQEALGALNDPRQAQEAIDAAYHRGVVVVASMADEASKHPNLPASLEHTMDVNS